MQVSFFKTSYDKFPVREEAVDRTKVFEYIKSGWWADNIRLVKEGKILKQLLPCFTPSGRFYKREAAQITHYNQMLCLDYDKVADMQACMDQIKKSPFTLCAFKSPSGTGIKVFVKITTGIDMHLIAYTQVKEFYDKITNEAADPKCKDIARLCYVSTDPDLFLNIAAIEYPVQIPVKPVQKELTYIVDDLYNYLVNFTKNSAAAGGGYYDTNRNNFIFCLACNCNRYGVDQETAMDLCAHVWQEDNAGFTETELKRTVSSAYKNSHEHAKYSLPQKITA